MLFVIHVMDKPGAHPLRMANYEGHKAYIADTARWGVAIVMSGPLVADDGATPVGSHFVIEAADRGAIEAFHKGDPFFKAGVWQQATISAFIKRRG